MNDSVPIGITIAAGSILWGAQWLNYYHTKQGSSTKLAHQIPSFRAPVATLIGAGLIGLISKVAPQAALGLSILIFIGAATRPASIQAITEVLPAQPSGRP